jgi:RNA-directed DNA polymerase
MDKVMLQKWLDAGYVQDGEWHATKAGTPQGGVASATIANLALDGLETMLKGHYPPRRNRQTKVHLVRYADDFVITGASKEVLEEAKVLVEDFLSVRGLSLSAEKTRIGRIEEGFDFLGWTVRKYDGKLLIMPAKKNVAAFMRTVRAIIKGAASMKQEYVIAKLNPVIRGWTNYHCNQVAKATFTKVDHLIWTLLWRWARRRHPTKSVRWVKAKYFAREGARDWVFRAVVKGDEKHRYVRLLKAADVPIRRHRKIQADANPFDPAWDKYLAERRRSFTVRPERSDLTALSTRSGELVALSTEGFAEA